MEENELIYFNEKRTVFIQDIVLQKIYKFRKEILHLTQINPTFFVPIHIHEFYIFWRHVLTIDKNALI